MLEFNATRDEKIERGYENVTYEIEQRKYPNILLYKETVSFNNNLVEVTRFDALSNTTDTHYYGIVNEEVKEMIKKVFTIASNIPQKFIKMKNRYRKEKLTITLPDKTSTLIIDGNITDGKDIIKDLIYKLYVGNCEICFY